MIRLSSVLNLTSTLKESKMSNRYSLSMKLIAMKVVIGMITSAMIDFADNNDRSAIITLNGIVKHINEFVKQINIK